MIIKLNFPRFFTGGIVVLAGLGFLIVFFAPQQLGAGPDSFAYVSAARSYAAGEGFRNVTWDGHTEVMAHFPPLYSFLLSGVGLGQTPLQMAKWLNALAFAGSIFLIGLLLHGLTGHKWIALAGPAIFLTSNVVLNAQFNIWTESLFIFWMLGAVYSLGWYEQTAQSKYRLTFLIITAVFVGFGALTRYAGVTLIGTTVLLLLLLQMTSKQHRWRDVLIFTTVASMPLIVWFLRNALLTDSATNRTIAYHAVQWQHIQDAISTFGLWFLPGIKTTVAASIGYLLVLVVAMSLKRPFRQPPSAIFLWCCLFVFVYFGFLLFSISFIDAHTPLNYRILFPLYAVSVIIVWTGFAKLLPKVQDIPFVRVLPLGAFMIYFILNVMAGWYVVRSFYQNGQGYTGVVWQESELMDSLSLLEENTTIYTNVPDAFYFTGDTIGIGVPIKLFATSKTQNEAYSVELEAMLKKVEEGSGVIVYFDRISRWYLPTEAELTQMAPLTAAFANQEGTIYVWENNNSQVDD